MKLLKRYAHAWIIPVYGIIYMLCFSYLEQKNTTGVQIIHLKIDDYIPFCEYFIIPYFLWFAFIAVTVFYFTFISQDKGAYYRLIFTLGIGMTVFLVVSYLFPNGQDLRPSSFTRDNLFIDMVKHLYQIDTPTNILPSIHVFNSVAAWIAIRSSFALRRYRAVQVGAFLLTVLIILATMFLKQHTIVDVIAAFILNAICYQLLYKPYTQAETARARAAIK